MLLPPTCSGAGRNGDPTKRWYCCWASTKTGGPSRVLGPAIAGYLRELATSSTERVLLIGEVAPHHWWEQVLFDRRGAVVARDAGLHTTALVCRLRFRLLHRPSTIAPAPARRPRGLVLPRR